ncbi:hypothetical protein GSI_07472 [Ganoderma sinense ZZ0214-1]|uniref:Cytochrome P450 n=1 Tax=Ganoderma sinense ZZ0214-1 TaxID=1077348 RepID=A0A2G8S946_9APHY|nr:hypothetical protein GSI_07472 [Ganoderma sinense ZZ0214-1]
MTVLCLWDDSEIAQPGLSFICNCMDVTLSDGGRIPEGIVLQAATSPQHHDDAYFADAGIFDPLRFAPERGAAPRRAQGVKHQASTNAREYLPFGHCKHACPARYFVMDTLKGVMAYIILNYAMKLGGDSARSLHVEAPMTLFLARYRRVSFRKCEGL